ncbi:AraC family transcriptional regulator [Hyphococcus sp.]|uniref:AraC family transcriptional regulator n=1 Tax=Hyphococcus sp. TaxID=2038636 RepID=UPI0020838C11|nr:MAG: AraC family transcriptional regulator [Marinicaulis sp.]
MMSCVVTNNAEASLPFHRHDDARVIVVIEGEICENSLAGRRTYQAGEFLFRPPFCAHENASSGKAAAFLRLPVSKKAWLAVVKRHGWRALSGQFDIRDRKHRVLLRPNASGDAFLDLSVGIPTGATQRPEIVLSKFFSVLANDSGVKPYALTRNVRREFGLTPTQFRSEWRLRSALNLLASSNAAIVDVASECGFADQSHLTRMVKSATGYAPAAFRRLIQG